MTTDVRALPVPAAVVFDLDGTLVDTVETRIDAWIETFQAVGLATDRDTLVPLIGLDGRRLAREIAALAGKPIDFDRSEAIDKQSGEIYERRNANPQPLPGVRHLIATIEAKGLPWSIATSSRKDQVGTSVAALGL